MPITFRRLTDDDLPTLHRWLNEPGVVRWWEGDDVSWEGVVRDYGSSNTDPVEHWIAVDGGVDVGWIQCYALTDDPEEQAEWLPLGVDPACAGIDYLVAEPARRGRGLGSAMIRAFVDDVVFGRHPHWAQAAAAPHVDNTASWRALAKAGFRHVADYDATTPSGWPGPWRLMAIDRGPTLPR